MNIVNTVAQTKINKNDRLFIDIDTELPNLTKVSINGIWFDKSLDERAYREQRRIDHEDNVYVCELEKLCVVMFRQLEMAAKFPSAIPSVEPMSRRLKDLGLLEGEE